MVETVTEVVEAVANRTAEDIHFNGDKVAVYGAFENPERSADQEDFMTALNYVEDGVLTAAGVGGLTIKNSDRFEGEVFVEYCNGDRRRATCFDELREAASLVVD